MTFVEKLNLVVEKNKSLVCVGLDSDFEKIPQCLKEGKDEEGQFSSRQRGEIILQFNQAIVDATKDVVCAYKPNSAFYEALGGRGIEILKQTISYIKKVAPAVPVILDAKRSDIGNTNEYYAQFFFSYLDADAVTVQPYLGRESLMPILNFADRGVLVLCRTSNPGAGEFQDLFVEASSRDGGNATGREELYKVVARKVAKEWNANGNCGLVVGATYPEELKEVRAIVGDMPILVPGVGAQGGDVEKTVRAGVTPKGDGMVVNSSRGIIFAGKGEDFVEKAREEAIKLRDEINKYRE